MARDDARPDAIADDPHPPRHRPTERVGSDRASLDLAVPDPAGLDPAVVGSADLDPTDLDPAVVGSADLDPTDLDPAVVDPADLDPAVVDPADPDPAVVGSADLDPTDPDPVAPARRRLTALRDSTVETLASLTSAHRSVVDASRDSNADDEHDPEGATIAFERAQVEALARDASARLASIDAAIHRLDAGTYGTCAVCGRPIPAARLEARPTATTCVACVAR